MDLLFHGIVNLTSIVWKYDNNQRRPLFELPLTFIYGVHEMLTVDKEMRMLRTMPSFDELTLSIGPWPSSNL
jgi:hypothetical protein